MEEPPSKLKNAKHKGWIFLALSLVFFEFLFWGVEKKLGAQAVALALLPALVGSWYLGVGKGILATSLALLLSVLSLTIKGYPITWLTFEKNGIAGFIAIYITSIIFGYLGRVELQYKEALNMRVRMAEKYEKQAASLTRLANITNKVLDATNTFSVLHTLAAQARMMFEADDCLISVWDQEEYSYLPSAADGDQQEMLESLPPRTEDDAISRLQTGDILVFAQLEELGDLGSEFRPLYPNGTLLLLPLIAGGEKLGILYLLYREKRTFSPSELTYAKLASRQISLAMSKNALLEEAQERVDELSALHAVALAMTEATDKTSLLKRTVESLERSLYPSNLTIVLLNQEKQALERQVSYQLDKSDIFDFIPLGQGVTGKVAQTGQLERIDDVRNTPHYIEALSSTRSEICVPIKMSNKILGVINIESDQFNAFITRDERLLTTIANQLAVALIRLEAEQQQIHRMDEIARSNSLIHALTQVAAQMEMSSEPDKVMHIMGDELKKLGFQALMALFIPGSQDLVLRYTSLDTVIVEKLERLSKFAMKDWRISSENLPRDINLAENLHPIILQDYIPVISTILGGISHNTLRHILSKNFDLEKMVLAHFPLVYQEKILGFLWLWATHLKKTDLPTLSIFASQVASALENTRLFADIQRLALTDGLTGLYTRRHFFELAYEEFYRARRYGHPLSILMLDIDHFKQINDTYGHATGDVILEQIAKTCKETLRSNDFIGRYGGEEIVILLVETELESAQKVAHRIWQNIRNLRVPTKKGEVQVTISGGVAGDNVERMNLIDMIEAADQAMYVAKNLGRDRIETFPKNGSS